jgi:hypothetical protein
MSIKLLPLNMKSRIVSKRFNVPVYKLSDASDMENLRYTYRVFEDNEDESE